MSLLGLNRPPPFIDPHIWGGKGAAGGITPEPCNLLKSNFALIRRVIRPNKQKKNGSNISSYARVMGAARV